MQHNNIPSPEQAHTPAEDRAEGTLSLRRRLIVGVAAAALAAAAVLSGTAAYKRLTAWDACEGTLRLDGSDPTDGIIFTPDGTEIFIHAWNLQSGDVEVGAGQSLLGGFSESVPAGHDVVFSPSESSKTNIVFHVSPDKVTTRCVALPDIETHQTP